MRAGIVFGCSLVISMTACAGDDSSGADDDHPPVLHVFPSEVSARPGDTVSMSILVAQFGDDERDVPIVVDGLPAGLTVRPLTVHLAPRPGASGLRGEGVLTFDLATTGGPDFARFDIRVGDAPESQPVPGYMYVRSRLDPGMVDPSYGVGGFVPMPDGAKVGALAVDAGGKVIVAANRAFDGALLLVRVGVDGMLDPSFGDGGVTVVDAPPPQQMSALGVAVGADGSVHAIVHVSGGTRHDEVVHVSSAGVPLDGITLDGLVGLSVRAARDDQGRYVVSGARNQGGPGSTHPVVARYTAGGVLDQTFDADGYVDHLGAAASDRWTDLVVRGNDLFTLARSFGTSVPQATIAHISPQGGTRTIDVADQVACCITVDGQGRALVGGGTFGALRLLEGPVIDTSFGTPWTFAPSAEPWSTHAMVALRDDGVVLAATRADRFGVMLGRMGPDGQPRSFTNFDPPWIHELSDVTEMVQLPGGAVLLAGTRFVGDGGVLAAVLMTDR